MKYIKTFEDLTRIPSRVEFVAPEEEHPSYKNQIKKRKRKKLGELEPVMVPPNHTKDVISFKRSG
jgi:hypothetical protein